jgi:hypothetical protein
MKKAPCAKFTILVTPKISDRPDATRKSEDALASPDKNCATNNCIWRLGAGQVRASRQRKDNRLVT